MLEDFKLPEGWTWLSRSTRSVACQSSDRRVTVDISRGWPPAHGHPYPWRPVTINWCACGSQDLAFTLEFLQTLRTATQLAAELAAAVKEFER